MYINSFKDNFPNLKAKKEIKKINYSEKKIAEANANKHKSYLPKWNKTDNQLTAYN